MDDLYRVKTPDGYYFSTGGGRYGRFHGSKIEGWVMCRGHATEIKELFDRYSDENGKAVLKVFNGHTKCQVCARGD